VLNVCLIRNVVYVYRVSRSIKYNSSAPIKRGTIIDDACYMYD